MLRSERRKVLVAALELILKLIHDCVTVCLEERGLIKNCLGYSTERSILIVDCVSDVGAHDEICYRDLATSQEAFLVQLELTLAEPMKFHCLFLDVSSHHLSLYLVW